MNRFIDLAKARYSVRRYTSAPVEDEKIRLILEAGSVAPTAKNNQPQKIYVIRNEEVKKKLAEVCPCTFGAPVIFAVGYDESLAAVGKITENYSFGTTDSTIVCTHMMLEAADLGLGSCWVGWFAEPEIKQALGITEENIRIRHLLPVGYPAPLAVPSHLHRDKRGVDAISEYI